MAGTPYIVTRGVVLRETETRDADKILTVLTAEQGKIAVIARGAQAANLQAVATEDAPHQELLSHLLNGLYAISVLHKPLPLVKAAFELKLLCLAGYAPLADTCAYCGRQDPEQPFFDVLDGVLRCGTCGGGERRGLPLCPDSLAALRHIVYGDAKRLYSFTLGSEAQKRLSAAAEAFLAAQLERGFKTLDFYKSVQGMA